MVVTKHWAGQGAQFPIRRGGADTPAMSVYWRSILRMTICECANKIGNMYIQARELLHQALTSMTESCFPSSSERDCGAAPKTKEQKKHNRHVIKCLSEVHFEGTRIP